jgi:hypothetical protein
MDYQEMVTELNSLVGQPVHIVSSPGGQAIGGDGVLVNVELPRAGNRQNGGARVKVEFKDGRKFAVDENTVEIKKVSKQVAKEGEGSSLNASEGDGEEFDESELQGAGESEDESEDEEAMEETPKIKKTKTSTRGKSKNTR